MKEIVNFVIGAIKAIVCAIVGTFAVVGAASLFVQVTHVDDTMEFYNKVVKDC